MRIKVIGKVIRASFLKIEERDVSWGKRLKKEGRLVKLVGDQNQSPEAPPRIMIGREKWEQRRCQGRSD